MLHLLLSLMNRLKTESAVFIFWMLYFQRIPLSENLTLNFQQTYYSLLKFCRRNFVACFLGDLKTKYLIPLLQLHTGHILPASVFNVYPFGQFLIQCTTAGHVRSIIIKSGFLVEVGGGGVSAEIHIIISKQVVNYSVHV